MLYREGSFFDQINARIAALEASASTSTSLKVYRGTTLKTSVKCVQKTGNVTSGSVVLHLTNDGTSTGTALFTNVYLDTINCFVNDAAASYQFSYALSNSNKTLTITSNKAAPTGIIGLLGLNLLGAPVAVPNGVTVNLTVWGD